MKTQRNGTMPKRALLAFCASLFLHACVSLLCRPFSLTPVSKSDEPFALPITVIFLRELPHRSDIETRHAIDVAGQAWFSKPKSQAAKTMSTMSSSLHVVFSTIKPTGSFAKDRPVGVFQFNHKGLSPRLRRSRPVEVVVESGPTPSLPEVAKTSVLPSEPPDLTDVNERMRDSLPSSGGSSIVRRSDIDMELEHLNETWHEPPPPARGLLSTLRIVDTPEGHLALVRIARVGPVGICAGWLVPNETPAFGDNTRGSWYVGLCSLSSAAPAGAVPEASAVPGDGETSPNPP
jgi:hypothetical protein